MKNSIRIGMASLLALAAAMAAAQDIAVKVNGDEVSFPVQQPIQEEGRVMVPLRGVFEQLGAYVTWHPETQTVQAVKGNTDVRVRIGSHIAEVNGERQQLDVPPELINGTTLVPLRFVSESLGAKVDWNNETRLVNITTGAIVAEREHYDHRPVVTPPPPRRAERLVANFTEYSVLPVTLNDHLASDENRPGDRFTASIETEGRNRYMGLPIGTRIEGHVVTARPRRGEQPGILELAFDKIRLPDGVAKPIDASLIGLDERSISTRGDGTLVARGNLQDDRIVYAGYGAGAGLLVGVLTRRPLENAVLGGILGYAIGTATRPSGRPTDVDLQPGTRFGVRLDSPLSLNLR